MNRTGAADSSRQVMWNRLIAVVEEQAQTLLRTAFSAIVREAGDLSAGVFDPQGRMLAQAVTGTPGHVNSMADSVGHFLARFPIATMQPGDVYITNDPWLGTGHLHDFVLVTPAFHRGAAGRAVRLHVPPGRYRRHAASAPTRRHVFEEGLCDPDAAARRGGRINADPARSWCAPTAAAPVEAEGDSTRSPTATTPAAGAWRHDARVRPRRPLRARRATSSSTSRAAMLERMRALPQGHLALPDDPRRLRPADRAGAALTIATDGDRGRLRRHLAGVALRHQRAQAYYEAYTGFGLNCAIAPEMPNNAGSLAPSGSRRPRAAS